MTVKTIELECEVCKLSFIRRLAEHTRNLKKNRRTVCSLKCNGVLCRYNIPEIYRQGRPENLRKGSSADEFSPFRNLLKNMKMRERKQPIKKVVDVTLIDLKELWDKQNGTCPYTGWKLILPINTAQWLERSPDRASVDRIDSNKGYTKDNIQIVSLIYQQAKSNWLDENVLNFCKSVASKHS